MYEKQKTNYLDIDFTDIEFYDEDILLNIERQLQGKIEGTDYNKCETSYKDRAFLNGIIRKTKPKTIVEIGCSAGGSSCVILNAIQDMENTKLYSFDYNTIWYRDVQLGQDNGRRTAFLVNQIVPKLIHKWEFYTGGVPCKYFDKLPQDGVDICFIDTAHYNPGEHFNILEVLPFMKKNGIVIYHDTAYHSLSNPIGTTCCVSINTLNGKRILLKSEHRVGLPNIGAIILDENIENMLFPLFSNLSLPWHSKITNDDFIQMFKHFSKYYSEELMQIYVYYCYFYMNGGLKDKNFAKMIAEKKLKYLQEHYLNERIKKAKIIHFHFNDKFANPTINFINTHFNQEEHLHLVFRSRLNSHSMQEFPNGENVIELNYEILNPQTLENKKLIFHSLFSQKNIELLYLHPNLLKHSYWMVWGGDFYSAPRDIYNEFVRKNIYGIGCHVDEELIKQKYGENHKFFNTHLATSPIDKEDIYEAAKVVKKIDSIVIQINNSADDTTLQMLDILAKFKNENILIRTVISYGKTQFNDEIIKKGKEIFGNKFSYLDKMLAPKEWLKYFLENDIVILCQNRQQGGSNCITALIAGKKVFIKSENTNKKNVQSIGAIVFDSDKISKMNFAEFVKFDNDTAEKNIKCFEEKNSITSKISKFKLVFDDNCFKNFEHGN